MKKKNTKSAAPSEVAALNLKDANWAGAQRAAQALANGATLDEALKLGKETPNTTPAPELTPDEPDEPDEPSERADPDDEDKHYWLRRYLSARINSKRNPNHLSDEELMDAALSLDEQYVHPSAWRERLNN